MPAPAPHAMLPEVAHDEMAAQDFVATLRAHLASRVAPGVARIYEHRALPRFRAEHQRDPADRHEVRRLMSTDGYYQFWSALQRRSQEMMWESVIEPVERRHGELVERARRLAGETGCGSLRLDETLEIPRYHTAVDIHLQPGGYHSDFRADDVAAGAIYDTALPIYLGGALGARNDALGQILVGYLRARWPDIRPRRILDMGCAIGNCTLPWAEAFPDAEVHGIDVGAPVLRYAHARASALGMPVHFSQQNAEATDFADGSFDLVVSHIMLHETSAKALPRILAESHRLLAPGGLMLHLEIPRGDTPFEQFMFDWETYNNNETFAGYMTGLDLPALACRAGFQTEYCRIERGGMDMETGQKNYGDHEFTFPILVGEKPQAVSASARA
ncbi:MAG: class I SAM-dependent methyltransferase [Gammaproteobacteria bacterium]|nr:class I SAM-dependent methyltransferase [Gammaproteobacteria bacterium]